MLSLLVAALCYVVTLATLASRRWFSRTQHRPVARLVHSLLFCFWIWYSSPCTGETILLLALGFMLGDAWQGASLLYLTRPTFAFLLLLGLWRCYELPIVCCGCARHVDRSGLLLNSRLDSAFWSFCLVLHSPCVCRADARWVGRRRTRRSSLLRRAHRRRLPLLRRVASGVCVLGSLTHALLSPLSLVGLALALLLTAWGSGTLLGAGCILGAFTAVFLGAGGCTTLTTRGRCGSPRSPSPSRLGSMLRGGGDTKRVRDRKAAEREVLTAFQALRAQFAASDPPPRAPPPPF